MTNRMSRTTDEHRSMAAVAAMYCKDDRIDVANEVLQCFSPGTSLRLESGYVLVEWENHRGKQSKRWMTRGQDFYPVWHRHW